MSLFAAILLLGQAEPAAPFPREIGSEPLFVRIRGGAWFSEGFRFDAVRTDLIHVASREDLLPAGGVDFGLSLPEGLFAFASAEGAFGRYTQVKAAGLSLGYREWRTPETPEGLPDEASVYAGAFYGTFDVDAVGFGNFDGAVGFWGGVSASWQLTRGIVASLQVEYRYADFKYQLPVLTGDRYAGGSGIWLGAALDFRF
jgi:hypothetical protein